MALFGFVLGFVVALTASLGTQLKYWDFAQGVKILAPGLAVGLAGLVCGATWLSRALWMNNSLAWRVGTLGLIGSLLLVGVPANHLWRSVTLPPIHDISTDIGGAPAFHALLLKRAGSPNPPSYDGPNVIRYDGERMTVALAQKYAYPDIKPSESLDNSIPQKKLVNKYFWRSLNAVNALGWRVAGFDIKTGRIEATDTSFWFGIVSDIAIRVRPAGASGVRVDIRAKSRIGDADAGRNAKLIRAFLTKVKGG